MLKYIFLLLIAILGLLQTCWQFASASMLESLGEQAFDAAGPFR